MESQLEIRETHEQIEHAHAHDNKRAAILIIALAAVLAITEIGGKEAQYSSLAHNIERSDLYAYYQAKTIRAAIARTASDTAELQAPPQARDETWQKHVDTWKQAADTLDSDPKGGEGRKELLAKAKAVEADRDREISTYHDFEFGSAALQLAIVMASAAVITELMVLEFVAFGLGLIGIALAAFAFLAPEALPL
jgi:hypothetical protein